MADDIIFTELLLNPPVASTEQTVHVKWQVGVDVNWYPSGSDEVRVFNTAGVLHCIQQMWNCDALGAQQTYSRGSGTITAPASEGAYVVCLYDFASKRRVFSSTLRVAGSKVGLPQEIDIKQAESAPHGCIDVSYNPHSLYGGFLALFPLAHPDNNGMNGHNESPFGCALVAVRTPTPDLLEGFDTTTFGFVAPQHVGEYQVRYLKTCRTNVLRSVALSNTFTVRGVAVEESVSSQAVRGKLTLPGAPRAGVKVGDLITVAWDITEGCAVLSELDCIFLYPYGRPEAVRQTDEICTVSTAPLSKWRVELHAPHEAGRYEAGYFSHRLQKFVLDGPSILVVGEHAKFTVDVDNIVSSIGEPVKVSWSIDEIVHRREDRCRIYDVGMNLYGSVPISDGCGFEENDTEEPLAAANEVLFARRMCGTLELRCDRPGRFIAVYYSSLLRRDVAKTEPFRITMQEDSLYYSRAIEVALTARLRQAPSMQICVKYTVSSSHGDTYGRLAARDCIGLFREGDRDCVAHHAFGSSHEIPALRLFWVDERESETIVFPAISTPGRYHVRYLTPTSLGRWGSVAQCAFEIVTEEVELQGGWVVEPFGQIPTTELAPVEVTLPDDDGDGLLQKATHCPRKAGIQGVTASLDAVPASRRAKSSSVILHYFPTPDFKGAVMVPHSVPFGDPVIVTYHVLEGKPLASDKIVIVDEFCTHVFAEASLGEASLGRENYTLGTVLLKPPRTQGLFMAAYYSIELRSVVVTSPLFRIRKSSIENVVSPVGKKVVEADRKSTVCKTGIREARFRAVLVGAQCSNASCSIRGTSNDVEMFRDCLLDNFPHATPDSILTLSDIEGAADPAKIPNAYNIRRGMEWLLEDSRPKDQIVFYFTGLGSRVNDYGHTELDEYDCCILPSDYDWRERVITFKEFRNNLYLAAPRGANVTVILDCCFSANTLDVAIQRGIFHEDEVSGTAVHCAAQRLKELRAKKGWGDRVVGKSLVPPQGTFHGYFRSKEREEAKCTEWDLELGGLHGLLRQMDSSADHEVRNDTSPDADSVEVYPGMWLLQACTPCSMAYEKFIGGKYHGLFTWALVQSIKALHTETLPHNPLWYRTVIFETQRKLAEWKFDQTPRLCVSEPDDVSKVLFHKET